MRSKITAELTKHKIKAAAETAEKKRLGRPPKRKEEPPPDPEKYLGPINAFPPGDGCLAIRGDPGVTAWQCCGRPRTGQSAYCDTHLQRFYE